MISDTRKYLDISYGVMVDLWTILSKSDSQWVPHTSDLVSQLSLQKNF